MSTIRASTLPAIGSSAEEKGALYEVRPIPEEVEPDNLFDASMQKLSTVPFSSINHNASIKNRLFTLESNGESQSEFDRLTIQAFSSLNDNVKSSEDHVKDLMKQLLSTIDAKMAGMRKEYDHRFELQLNENKRLQNSVATLKADNNYLKQKLQSTIEKLRKMQQDFGDPDGDLEEESSVATLGASFNASTNLRPNTIA